MKLNIHMPHLMTTPNRNLQIRSFLGVITGYVNLWCVIVPCCCLPRRFSDGCPPLSVSEALGFSDSCALASVQPAHRQSSARPQIRIIAAYTRPRGTAFWLRGGRDTRPLPQSLIKEHRFPPFMLLSTHHIECSWRLLPERERERGNLCFKVMPLTSWFRTLYTDKHYTHT